MSSLTVRLLVTFGLRVIGRTVQTDIFGYREPGCYRLPLDFYGLQAIGDGAVAPSYGTPGFGGRKWASMAVSIMAMGTTVMDIKADIGAARTSITTKPSIV